MTVLSIKEVSKRYEGHTALNKVSFDVSAGSIFGLLGPNGAGKTTLIRIITQITGSDEGEIFFQGEKLNISHIPHFGYLPEERGLYKKMKAGEQAIYLARLKGLSYSDAVNRVKEWFMRLGIENWWDKRVEELSKGMQQKLQFIVTVIHRPSLLILDEPFSGFDPVNMELIRNEMLRLKNEGATILLSTHDMNSVEELCDDIALIHKSKVILHGNVQKIRENFSRNLFYVISGDNISAELASNLAQEGILLEGFEKSNGWYSYTFSIDNNLTSNDLLKDLMPYIPIRGFGDKLPSMHDIFVSFVKNQ